MSIVTPMLRIRLIGVPRLERDGAPIESPRGAKTWALLARLVRSEGPVSRQRLVEELFPEADDPRGALRWSLAELRRRTGLTDRFGGDPVEVDLGPDVVVDVDQLRGGEFDAIPEGEFLEGVNVKGAPAFESWLLIERQRIDGEIASQLRESTLRSISSRSFERAIDLAGAMVRRTPYEEGPHVLLIKALALSGDTEAAVRQVEASESTFRDELGVEPSPALRNAARPSVAAAVPGVSSLASAQSMLRAGLAAVSSGAVDAGIECLRRACADAADAGDDQLLASCLVELGTALVHSIRGYDDEGSVVLGDAVKAARSSGDQLVAAKAISELGYIDIIAGRRQSAATHLTEAEALASGDVALQAALAGFQAMNLSDWGREDEAFEQFERALELATGSDLHRRRGWVLGLGARTLFQLDRYGEAERWARQSLEVADDERWTAFRPWPEGWLSFIQLAQGRDPLEVRAEAEATFALARQLQDPCWEGVAALVIGLTHVRAGDGASGLDWIENAGNWCMRVTDGYRWVETWIHLNEARIQLEIGDHERAESMARRTISESAAREMDGLLAGGMEILGAVKT